MYIKAFFDICLSENAQIPRSRSSLEKQLGLSPRTSFFPHALPLLSDSTKEMLS